MTRFHREYLYFFIFHFNYLFTSGYFYIISLNVSIMPYRNLPRVMDRLMDNCNVGGCLHRMMMWTCPSTNWMMMMTTMKRKEVAVHPWRAHRLSKASMRLDNVTANRVHALVRCLRQVRLRIQHPAEVDLRGEAALSASCQSLAVCRLLCVDILSCHAVLL